MSFYKRANYAMEKIYIIFLSLVQNKLGVCTLFFASVFTIQSHASDTNVPEREKQLLKSCDTFKTEPTHPNALLCSYYIQGYLSGAWGVNNVKASKLKKNKQESPTWTERAYNNRVGKRTERFKSNNTTYFCAPVKKPEEQILNKLVKNLVSPIKSIPALHTQIYIAITEVCPSGKRGDK